METGLSKRILCLALSILTIAIFAFATVGVPIVALADDEQEWVEYYREDTTDTAHVIEEGQVRSKDVNININGTRLSFDNYNGVGPIIVVDENGGERTLVPIRSISEALGYDVDYNKTDLSVQIVQKGEDGFNYSSGRLPERCEDVYNLLAEHTTDSNVGNDTTSTNVTFGTTYQLWQRKSLDKEGLQRFRDRITEEYQDCLYGVTLRIGNKQANIFISGNDSQQLHSAWLPCQMEVTAKLYRDYTMVPLRAVGSMLGLDVTWDNSSRTARLTSR